MRGVQGLFGGVNHGPALADIAVLADGRDLKALADSLRREAALRQQGTQGGEIRIRAGAGRKMAHGVRFGRVGSQFRENIARRGFAPAPPFWYC